MARRCDHQGAAGSLGRAEGVEPAVWELLDLLHHRALAAELHHREENRALGVGDRVGDSLKRDLRVAVWREADGYGGKAPSAPLEPPRGELAVIKAGRILPGLLEGLSVELGQLAVVEDENVVRLDVESAGREVGGATEHL